MSHRVLIVDDHAGFRSIARRLLEAGGYEVVGEAADGSSAMRAAHDLQPDLVLLDIQLPDIDGCQVASWLMATHVPRGFVAKAELSGAALGALLREP